MSYDYLILTGPAISVTIFLIWGIKELWTK
jgi:hypothetical protein